MFKFLMKHTNITCDAMKCNHFQRHYADRSKLKNECIASENSIINVNDYDVHEQYAIQLIGRIHVYFVHSYDIDRLTPTEIEAVNKIFDEEKQMNIINEFKRQKKNKFNMTLNNDKFTEGATESMQDVINVWKLRIYQSKK
eukprot:485324_1